MNGMPERVSDNCLSAIVGCARDARQPQWSWLETHAARVFGQADAIPSYRITDWMAAARLNGMRAEVLASLVGTTVVTCYVRPRSKSRVAVGGDGLLPAVFCNALLRLEDIGFPCGGALAAAAHRPLIMKRAHITQHELRVLWAAKEAGRMTPFSLVGTTPPQDWPIDGAVLDMPSGAKLYVGCDHDGTPAMVAPCSGRRVNIETECYRVGLSHLSVRGSTRPRKEASRQHAH